MSEHFDNTDSYAITIANNAIVHVERMAAEDELLGIEWAISEVKDSLKHSGSADGSYGLKDKAELQEFMDYLASKIGEDAVQAWRERVR
jgi:hypothetical protein